MFAFIVTLRSGHRYTIRAEELRVSGDGSVEFLAAPAPADDAGLARKVIALFDRSDVLSIVAREHLVACEEPGTVNPRPHVVAKTDPIPF
jgi:hypothetical protein